MFLLRQLALLLLPLLAITQSSTADNQQCYFGVGELASTEFTPCYTKLSREPTSCCKRGNVCLEHNACYDAGTGITYQSGCTDDTYKHASCPRKCGLDTKKSSWVGVVYCNGADGTPNNTWICNHPDTCKNTTPCPNAPWEPLLQKLPPNAKCSNMNTNLKAIDAPGTLSDLSTIPATIMSSYFAAQPTTKPSAQPATQSASPTAGGTDVTKAVVSTIWQTVISTQPGTKPEGSSNSSSSSSSSNINGMAIGLGVSVPLVLAIISAAAFFFLRRRKRAVNPELTTVVSAKGSPVSPNDSEHGYAFKAELPADSAAQARPAELPHSGMDYAPGDAKRKQKSKEVYELSG